ncbi:disintegrin and metalloproteinase domain-containing protein 1b-like [Perognathus longimembris pacificus]|uniref:disintegrin and metalloproteinase domain-containing protein 1b-like n=1 Tax=Perognathus longimembris pacificus TaxID=214514 RepID=UPI0020197826|nr:disintegrin and metalloproteinase domain-containing protein 1b-like [Perognathus longimembris pacificus]
MPVVTSLRVSASISPSLWKTQAVKVMFQTWAPQMKGWRLGLVPGHWCVRLAAMVLLGVLLLPSIQCDLESVHGSSYEIVIPESLTVKRGEGPEQQASYMLFMQGQKQLLHLKVKTDYFVSGFPIYSYHSGILEQATPWLSLDCHYEGYIEGVPRSFVSVNICSGLRGILIKAETSYGIEPMLSSQQFEHVLYTMAHQAPASCRVASTHSPVVSTGRQQESRKPHSPQLLSYLWSHTKYVEMFVVVNYQRFQMWGSNINDTVRGVLDIIALANSFTRGLNTKVVLAGMEIWTEGDLIEVPVDLWATLRNFNSWRREELVHRVRHDVAHMIVGHHPGENMGQAFLSGACSSGFAAAVESFHHEDVLLFATLMVHELGHNLGIPHDHSACVCKGKHFCLMHENITKGHGFSNCSSDYFYRFLHKHKGACLFNKPQHKSHKRRGATCGNGVIEESEQCDCGGSCDTDPCCTLNCKLKHNAQCSNELCCSKCQIQKRGFLCRPLVGLCDLPEYCDGSSPMCPQNRYLEDGSPCSEVYYCLNGHCMDHSGQCVFVFGETARVAPTACYTAMNNRADRFGHCGRPSESSQSFKKCSDENAMCGKIFCMSVTLMPKITPGHTLIQVPHKGDYCWTIDAFEKAGVHEIGDVWKGTICGEGQTCQDYTCIHSKIMKPSCNLDTICNSRGVCNDLRNCHCIPGTAPPDCRNRGNGGSIDSGPPKKHKKEDPQEEETETEEELAKSTQIIIVVIILTIVILGIIIYLLCISKEEEEKEEEAEEEEGEKPETEEKKEEAKEEDEDEDESD